MNVSSLREGRRKEEECSSVSLTKLSTLLNNWLSLSSLPALAERDCSEK
jgi:hypothetical protein